MYSCIIIIRDVDATEGTQVLGHDRLQESRLVYLLDFPAVSVRSSLEIAQD